MDFEENFRELLSESGVPTTEQAARKAWQKELDDADVTIANNSLYSPFWRIIEVLLTKPLLWLVNQLMVNTVLPNCFLQTAKGKWLDILAWGYEITRQEAIKAQGTITITRNNVEQALTIAQGKQVESLRINNVVYRFNLLADVVFLEGQETANVLVEAEKTGLDYNLGPNSIAGLVEPIDGITISNVANWITRLGADTEKDEPLRLRCRNQFTAVTSYHTDAVYISLVTSIGGIGVKNIYIEHNAPRGPGTANIHILPDVGQADPQFLADTEYHLMDEGNHGLGDDVALMAIPETQHNIEAEVLVKMGVSNEDKATLISDIGFFIRNAFRENNAYSATKTKPFSVFSFSALDGELHKQFPNLENVRFNQGAILSELSIPRLQSLSVIEGSYA